MRNLAGVLRWFRGRRPRAAARRVALVLCGGGIGGGMFEVGALTALDDFLAPQRRVTDLDLFVGVSAGAVVAALMANGVRPREAYEAIRHDAPSPLNVKMADVAGVPWRAAGGVAVRVLRTATAQAAAMVGAGPAGLLGTIPRLLAESIPPGLVSLTRLERRLARLLSAPPFSNDFRQLRRPLLIPAVALDSGQRWVFGTPPLEHIPISQAVVASSAIPGFFDPVRIDDTDLVDGGVDRVEHLDVAVAHGATAILLINPIVPFANGDGACLPGPAGGCARVSEQGAAAVKEQATRLNRQRKLALSLERHRTEFPAIPVFLIEPDPANPLMFVEDMMRDAVRLGALEHGYETTRGWLTVHGAQLREALEAVGLPPAEPANDGREPPALGGLAAGGEAVSAGRGRAAATAPWNGQPHRPDQNSQHH